jgi:threonine aldolase
MMFGEAVIFFDPRLAAEFKYIRKQGMQLHSKMRFISAQFDAFLTHDLWQKNALHANKMAGILADSLEPLKEIRFTQAVQTNGVFAIIPEKIIKPLQDVYFFYIWNENENEVRWMTSWDTKREDIEAFVRHIKKLL